MPLGVVWPITFSYSWGSASRSIMRTVFDRTPWRYQRLEGKRSAQAMAADLAPQLQALLAQGKSFPDVKK
ncbi:MAG TPA: hypothetical protein VFX49_22180 [Chloroflexota bacterium]|nr:hypothetical protein [Chloroflexota bacterium]